ncbi:hypothetical protein FGS76_03025 [Alloalcanivorax gelatiniphagus]|uniref:Uncharacterized protein n=1 Tax=Alloalcanivorax gelatiniphagus TaxID=1194167 RepID=A0ABY2XPG7_9GAMM|nr:hypothetical protein FGS76_03025 [Alloalcanivorax gelatiniphagus]
MSIVKRRQRPLPKRGHGGAATGNTQPCPAPASGTGGRRFSGQMWITLWIGCQERADNRVLPAPPPRCGAAGPAGFSGCPAGRRPGPGPDPRRGRRGPGPSGPGRW